MIIARSNPDQTKISLALAVITCFCFHLSSVRLWRGFPLGIIKLVKCSIRLLFRINSSCWIILLEAFRCSKLQQKIQSSIHHIFRFAGLPIVSLHSRRQPSLLFDFVFSKTVTSVLDQSTVTFSELTNTTTLQTISSIRFFSNFLHCPKHMFTGCWVLPLFSK